LVEKDTHTRNNQQQQQDEENTKKKGDVGLTVG
jgi:hypothetical protein